MKRKLLIVLLLVKLSAVTAQVGISYYPFQSLLSVSSNTEKPVWIDYRVETNTFLSNLNMEISPMWNFTRADHVNYYVGAGVNFNPVNALADLPVMSGYFASAGARIKPIQKHPNAHLIFEISPYLNSQFTGGNLRTRLGIGYNFRPKGDKE